MPGPAIAATLAWLVLGAPVLAVPIPPGALETAKDIDLCWKSNPFSTGALPQNETRSNLWNNACVEQRDACALLNDDAERRAVQDSYCLQCSNKAAPGACPDGTDCESEQVCKAPSPGVKVALGPPSEGEGNFEQTSPAPMPEPDPGAMVCNNTPGCITRYLSSVYAEGARFRDEVNAAWSASNADRDHNDFTKCDELTLRNTEHYLYHYWARLDSLAYDKFPLSFCAISYGYSTAKWLGIKQVFVKDGSGNVSPPSMEEAYWGCRGLWDAYEVDRKVAVGKCRY